MLYDEVQEVRPGVKDWSTLHKPATTELYGDVQGKEEWQGYKLSQEKVDRFWKDGVLLNEQILTSEECDKILEEYKYLLAAESERHPAHDLLYEHHANQSGDPDNVLMHCLGQWRLTPLFHDLVFHPKIIAKCSQLLVQGEEKSVRFWHDQAFAKPAKHGGVVAWHQDYSYWDRTKPCAHITVHIALDDQTEENGCLKYIPGSHGWTRDGNPLPVLDFNFKDMEGIKTILTPKELDTFKPVPSMLKKGQVSFHHSLTVHGSYGNRSDNPRRAAVLNYFADGVRSDTDGMMLCMKNGDGGVPKGERMQGQFYPLVFEPAWAN